jgi:DNA polymerase-3 subunit delta'
LGAFLPTLLSRCAIYKIPPLDRVIIEDYLIQRGIAHDKARIAAQFSGGSIGQAMILAQDEDFAALRQMTLNLAANIAQMDIAAIFAAAKELESYKDNIRDILDILKLHYRDELVAAAQGQSDTKYILHKIHAIDDTKEKLSRNCQFLLCMEILLLQLSGQLSN